MKKKNIYLVAVICLAVTITGCETVPKKFKEEVVGIKTRVETLESRVEGVETRQTDIERTTTEQQEKIEGLNAPRERRVRTNIGTKRKPRKEEASVREIQVCLKNAGFYTGSLDGIKGRKTRRAIREFQKANGLTPDGIVGKKTRELLSRYSTLSAAHSGTEEGPK